MSSGGRVNRRLGHPLAVLWCQIHRNGLQLRLRHGLENAGTDLFIGNLGVQHNLGHFPKRMDVSRQSFTMRGMMGLLGTLRPPEDAHDQVVKRDQKPIE